MTLTIRCKYISHLLLFTMSQIDKHKTVVLTSLLTYINIYHIVSNTTDLNLILNLQNDPDMKTSQSLYSGIQNNWAHNYLTMIIPG